MFWRRYSLLLKILNIEKKKGKKNISVHEWNQKSDVGNSLLNQKLDYFGYCCCCCNCFDYSHYLACWPGSETWQTHWTRQRTPYPGQLLLLQLLLLQNLLLLILFD